MHYILKEIGINLSEKKEIVKKSLPSPKRRR
jgi:hypothetical protein